MMETEQTEMTTISPEGDSVCLICLQLYNDENKCTDSAKLQYFQNVFDDVSKYLSAEIFANCFQWNFVEEGSVPVCSTCCVSMEKIFKISRQLDKLQNAIENAINSFTSEVMGHHNKLEFLYTNKGAEGSPSVSEVELKVEQIDYGLHEEDDDFGNDPLDCLNETICQVDDEPFVDGETPKIPSQLDVTALPKGKSLLKSSTPTEVLSTSGSVPKISDVHDTTKYQNILLKPLRIVLTRSSTATADNISTTSASNSNTNPIIKPLRIFLTRLQFDSNGNVITPTDIKLSSRKASIKVNVALKRTGKKDSKANRKINRRNASKKIKRGGLKEAKNIEMHNSNDSESQNEYENSQKYQKIKVTKYRIVTKRFQCQDKFCQLGFNFSKEIESHSLESGHVNEKEHKCKKCFKSFFKKADAKSHSKIHQENNLWKCKRCSKKFKQKKMLCIHKFRRHSEKLFKCENCEKRFQRKINYENHAKLHSKELFECEKCCEKFHWRLSVKAHHCKASNAKIRSCSFCSKKFTNRLSLSRHRLTHFKTKVRRQIACYGCNNVHFIERAWDNCIIKNFRTEAIPGFVCAICTAVFKTANELDDHSYENKHVNKKHFFCFVCRKPYYNPRGLKNHIRIHKKGDTVSQFRKTNVLKCHICPKKFKIHRLRSAHIKEHTENRESGKKLSCLDCNKKFKYQNNLEDHLNTHTGEKPHSCKMCDKSFYHRNELFRHSRYCSKESETEAFSCEICNKVLRKEHKYKRHLRNHREVKMNKIPCKFCEKILVSMNSLRSHLKTHSAFQHKCSECELSFNMHYKLERHKLSAHTSEEPYACSMCDKKFKIKRYRDRHIRNHKKKPLPCDFCGKCFIDNYFLTLHKRIHTGDLFNCSLCDKKFTNQSALTKHNKVIHTKETKYMCEICQKCFTKAQSLRYHLRTHTGEKQFHCQQCSYSSRSNDLLVRHIKVSHIEKEVGCEVCGKLFSTETSLNIHQKVHGEKKFQCEVCSFSCSRKDNLMSHVRSHTKDKPYLCTICGKSFARKDYLNTHMKWHQKDKSKERDLSAYGNDCDE